MMMMNFLDLSAASEEECRLIREILSDTSVVNIADPIESKLIATSATTLASASIAAATTPTSATTTLTNSAKTPAAAVATTTTSTTAPQQNYRNSYNGQRKSAQQQHQQLLHNNNHPHHQHNSGNIGNNSSGTNSSSANRIRIPSLSNVSPSGSSSSSINVQQHQHQHYQQSIHPQQQFTPPLPPSNVISTTLYHANINHINNNSNSSQHSSTAINNSNNSSSQLSHQQRASNEQHQHHQQQHSNDRLRSMGNHNHHGSSNHINTVSTSSSVMPNMSQINHLDPQQHHGNAMPNLNMYTNHQHMHHHHQVPSVPMQSAQKPVDAKSNTNSGGNKSYHVQKTPNNLQQQIAPPQGGQPSQAQMTRMAGDMNTVIGMDMSAHPQGYAIQAFAPPHPHQMFSGPPIFQHHPYPYLIPYNLPPYVPYVPIATNTGPPRTQVQQPQTCQTPSSVATTVSHSRAVHSMNQQQLNNEHYDPGLPNDRSSNFLQLRQDISQAADHNQVVSDRGFTSNSRMVQGTNASSVSQRLISEDNISTNNASPVTQNSTIPLIEKSIKTTNSSNKSSNLAKISPPVSKDKETLATKSIENEHHVPKLDSVRTSVPLSNGQLSDENVQRNAARGALPVITSITSGNPEAPKPTINASPNIQSSPEDSKTVQETSIEPNSNLKKKLESAEVCNKSSIDQVVPDQDAKNAEAIDKTGGQGMSSASKSWADLFKKRENGATHPHDVGAENCTQWVENSDEEGKTQKSSKNNELPTNSTSAASTREQRSQDIAKRALDKTAHKIAMKVNTINLKHALPFLKPRGFINKGNGCYINATLQALIACPPFYNLMKEIGELRAFRRENSCTPILDSFAELFLHFPPPIDSGKKVKQTGSNEPKPCIQSLQAEAIEPKCIYNVLGNIKSECLKGAQEDAEEFLSSVLNGLHEEMISLGEILHESYGQTNQQSDVDDSNDDNTNDDNLWREVGSKNRSLPIRIAKVVNTPIQEIFGGSLFSIRTAGRDRCGHRSPFFDLQLDISGDNVKSVQDAIKSFTSPEIIHDFYCSKTKQKLDAQRKTSLDQLPPILILHLKQFIYTQDCGLKKLMKKIEYPIELELPESCLHEKNSADRNLLTSRSYKLLAVVYHDGKEAVKGHYLTDVYHIGSSQWIRCDDSNLKAISSPRIENPDAPRTPYLLFYRRLNTLRAQSNNHDNKKKN